MGTVSDWELSVLAGIVCVIFVLCVILFWNSVGTLRGAYVWLANCVVLLEL